MRYLIIFVCFLLVSCSGFSIKEEVYMPEYTPEISVFGVLSNNGSQEFVVVERTMQLNERYETGHSKITIDDAIVTIMSDSDTTEFMFTENVNHMSYYAEGDYIISNMYVDFNQKFFAIPGKSYKLKVQVPDGREVTAQTTLPEAPEIYAPQSFSRIKRSELKNVLVKWKDDPDAVAYCVSLLIKTKAIHYKGGYIPATWINILDDEYEMYYDPPANLVHIDDSIFNTPAGTISDTAMIKIEAIDRMLYDYASKNEMASLVGTDFNLVEGGVGVFGSICVDSVKIILE